MKINPIVWPIGITISIMIIAGMCVWTIAVAQSMPVHDDKSYFADYRDVDMNINEIIATQQKFDKKYNVYFKDEAFIIGENSVKLKITDKENNSINSAKVDILITRPLTSVSDKKLIPTKTEDGVYIFEPFDIKDLGRWQIQSRIIIDDLIAFNKIEVNATN